MVKGETLKSPNNTDGWKELAKMARSFEESQKEQAPERLKGFYRNILGYQRSFGKRLDALDKTSGRMTKKEFETWEDLIGNELRLTESESNRANLGLEDVAEGEQYMVLSGNDKDIGKTVEVQAGRFYHQRMSELKKAIETTGGDKEDLKYLNEFYPMVVKHLDFKYMSIADVVEYGHEAYDRKRTESHNAVIRHLNGLNGLARKYQIRPLTVRDFWTSDIRREDDQTPAVARIMKYDRKIVEAYYEKAFSSEARRFSARLERESKMGLF